MNCFPISRRIPRLRGNSSTIRGFAIAEAVVAMALVSLTLSGVFAMNGRLLGLLRQGKESSYATQMIQERADLIRTGLWDQVTDPAKIATTILGAPAVTAANLPGATEIITIEPLPSTGSVGQCVRSPNGSVSTSGSALSAERSVKATVTVQWPSQNRVRSRSAVTILTTGGI